jgi:hypothetical protein
VPGIVLIAGEPDPFGGFVRSRPGPEFHRLGCGRVITGAGAREGVADLTDRMDSLRA